MPNLEQAHVTGWLAELRPDRDAAAWPPAVRTVETAEGVPQRMVALGHLLDQVRPDTISNLSVALRHEPLRGEASAVLAQVGGARVMRVLHWLAEADVPECHAVTSRLLEGGDASGCALRAAVAAVTQRATLQRMFAPERVAALERACHHVAKGAV